MKQTLDIIRGTSFTASITVANASGSQYVLSGTDKLRFCVKRNSDDSTYVIQKELTSSQYNNGGYTLHLAPSDTENLEIGRYYYDCGLQIGNEYYMIIEKSQFNILQNISARSV